jgi:hypothetical protein
VSDDAVDAEIVTKAEVGRTAHVGARSGWRKMTAA